jgi:rhodanese-related sulfurtransferase
MSSSSLLDCASISCDELAQLLHSGGAVVVDVRPFDDYSEQHVVSALAVRLSSLLRRRLTQGRIGLGDVICDPQRIWASKSQDAMVVVYDDSASFSGPVPYNTSLALHIVLMSLQREGINCAFLHGESDVVSKAERD